MSKPRVLCVDDEPNVLDGLKRHLRRDFEIVTAVGGEEALQIVQREEPFEVIVSDLRMPGMDGIEFLRRAAEIHPETTRMILTGNADLSAALKAVNEGVLYRFLSKPCADEELRSAIAAAAERHRKLADGS